MNDTRCTRCGTELGPEAVRLEAELTALRAALESKAPGLERLTANMARVPELERDLAQARREREELISQHMKEMEEQGRYLDSVNHEANELRAERDKALADLAQARKERDEAIAHGKHVTNEARVYRNEREQQMVRASAAEARADALEAALREARGFVVLNPDSPTSPHLLVVIDAALAGENERNERDMKNITPAPVAEPDCPACAERKAQRNAERLRNQVKP